MEIVEIVESKFIIRVFYWTGACLARSGRSRSKVLLRQKVSLLRGHHDVRHLLMVNIVASDPVVTRARTKMVQDR